MVSDVTFTSRPSYMGDNVGDDDGTSRTPLISLPCATLRYPSALICLSFSSLYREIMHMFLSLSSEP